LLPIAAPTPTNNALANPPNIHIHQWTFLGLGAITVVSVDFEADSVDNFTAVIVVAPAASPAGGTVGRRLERRERREIVARKRVPEAEEKVEAARAVRKGLA
jgi:hypothetical protein